MQNNKSYHRGPSEETCVYLNDDKICVLTINTRPEDYPNGSDELGYCDINTPFDCEKYCPNRNGKADE
jgi:hypothetical protein